MIKIWKRALKKLDVWDIALIKLYSVAFILFFITIWPAAMNWVHSVNPLWFLAAFVILATRPLYRDYMN